jgi:NAD(P)-dependent dehydrogenase (short-subunit alcohol dehydrogenase family)
MSGQSTNNVVITGAAGNLGKAVAKRFSKESARVILLDHDPGRLEQARQELGGNCHTFQVNLIDLKSVTSTIEAIIAQFGSIDVLANIAGGFTMGPLLHETPEKDWNFMFDLNTRSVFNMCHEVIPHMLKKNRGKIINVSARAAREGKAKMGPYCASKAAVITLTETLAAEYKLSDINVNCILPGTIDTPQNRADMPDADFDRWVPPAALADVVAFLASEQARCITGASIPVYGKS